MLLVLVLGRGGFRDGPGLGVRSLPWFFLVMWVCRVAAVCICVLWVPDSFGYVVSAGVGWGRACRRTVRGRPRGMLWCVSGAAAVCGQGLISLRAWWYVSMRLYLCTKYFTSLGCRAISCGPMSAVSGFFLSPSIILSTVVLGLAMSWNCVAII